VQIADYRSWRNPADSAGSPAKVNRVKFAMPKAKKTSRPSQSAPRANGGRERRIDAAHQISRPESSESKTLVKSPAAAQSTIEASELAAQALAAEASLSLDVERLEASDNERERLSIQAIQTFRTHAQQLATQLESRQRELDRREAQFHAHLAKQESEARSARLWFQERHHELVERQATLDALEERLSTQEKRQTEKPIAQSQPLDHLPDLDQELLRNLAEQHELAEGITQRERQCDAIDRAFQEREQRLAAAEASLAQAQTELEAAWQKFHNQKDAWCGERQDWRDKLTAERKRFEAECAARHDRLLERSNQLEMRAAALDQTRAEVLQAQRETLEMRLTIDEVWAQLSRLAPPAAITQSLARVRSKLTDHYRAQLNDIAQQRADLEGLAAKISQQHERLARQRRDFDESARSQQTEIEMQAARLVAREQELDEAQRRLEQTTAEWEAQRQELRRQIRRLESEIRQADAERLCAA
jgi:hypothetical protein